MTDTEHFVVGYVVYAGRPPTFYCAKGKKEYLGKVEAVIPPFRRRPCRYVIKFNEADAYGDTDAVTVPHSRGGYVLVFHADLQTDANKPTSDDSSGSTNLTVSPKPLNAVEESTTADEDAVVVSTADGDTVDVSNAEQSCEEEPVVTETPEPAPVVRRQRRVYRCRICGLPKRDHVCTGIPQTAISLPPAPTPASTTSIPPSVTT